MINLLLMMFFHFLKFLIIFFVFQIENLKHSIQKIVERLDAIVLVKNVPLCFGLKLYHLLILANSQIIHTSLQPDAVHL